MLVFRSSSYADYEEAKKRGKHLNELVVKLILVFLRIV
jgi:hypothetical protein